MARHPPLGSLFGAVLGFMVPGDMSAAGWTRVDLIGKFVFQVLAVVGFLLLAREKSGPAARVR